MSAAPGELEPVAALPAATPARLAARYDDPIDPSELTLYDPESEKQTTEWLSADPETARSLEAMR